MEGQLGHVEPLNAVDDNKKVWQSDTDSATNENGGDLNVYEVCVVQESAAEIQKSSESAACSRSTVFNSLISSFSIDSFNSLFAARGDQLYSSFI